MYTIPYGHQLISESDIDAVVDVLRSDFLTQGPLVPQFEEAVCNYSGADYGVAVNSGTSALHIACLALELGEGDWLWTSPISFLASANCGRYCGASVDFVDIDSKTWNISISALEQKLVKAEQNGKLPKILVTVHLCGLSCDMDAIAILADKYGIAVIEDACHAMGGSFQGKPVGGCQNSDVTVFSFHPVKNITTGEGGMAVTNDRLLADRMRLLRSHGVTKDPLLMDKGHNDPWYYQQLELGFNYRMTDIQAALGISQLKRLEEFILSRREIASRYDSALYSLPIQLPVEPNNVKSGWHLYVIRSKGLDAEDRRAKLFHYLKQCGINVHVHYIPIHLQPYYSQFGFRCGDFPEAERYYKEALTLPIYPDLNEYDQELVINKVIEWFEKYSE